jgi:hypothetical protein
VKHELTITPAQQQQTQDNQGATDRHQHPCAIAIKHGTDLDADKKDDEQIQAEDPTDL